MRSSIASCKTRCPRQEIPLRRLACDLRGARPLSPFASRHRQPPPVTLGFLDARSEGALPLLQTHASADAGRRATEIDRPGCLSAAPA